MEENQITIVDEKGNEHLCEIIFTLTLKIWKNHT